MGHDSENSIPPRGAVVKIVLQNQLSLLADDDVHGLEHEKE